MSKTSPKLIFFDLGDVLYQFVPALRLETFAQRVNMSESRLDELIWQSGLSSQFDAGGYTRQAMSRKISDVIDVELSDKEVADIWCKAFVLNQPVYELAERVSEFTRVGLLTNNPPALRAAIPTWMPEIEALFNPIIFSYELQATKPNPIVFETI
ncbi:MAG: hypothetical protein AAF512_07065, partial [Pseudomonadota bacterium]